MKRRITFISIDEDTPDSRTRNNLLLAEANRHGFRVVANELVDDRNAADIRLADLCIGTVNEARITSSGLVTLNDVTELTAYEAWHRLAGSKLWAGEGGAHEKRGIGSSFKLICQAMVRSGLKFTDLDPASFRLYSAGDWREHGLTGRPAGILEHMEVYHLQIFLRLTGEDIAAFNRCGTTYQDALVAARDRLKATHCA